MQYRIVPFINDGAMWWQLQLQQKRWFFWTGVWMYCTKERAVNALNEFRHGKSEFDAPSD